MTDFDAYPPQEPLSPAALAYHSCVSKLGENVKGEQVAYGDDPYQQILIYRASRPSSAALAFIHGGGWTNGYKEWMAFMAPAVNDMGLTFVSIGYRLAPLHLFPASLDDCANGLILSQGIVQIPRRFLSAGILPAVTTRHCSPLRTNGGANEVSLPTRFKAASPCRAFIGLAKVRVYLSAHDS